MSTQIQIYKSTDGGNTYSLLTSIPDSSPYSFTDSTVAAGSNYSYKTRRYRLDDGVYSSFSSVVSLTAPTTSQGTPIMPFDTIIGANSLLGIGIESSEGTPVQVQKLLDYTSGTITAEHKVIYSKALRRTVAGKVKKCAGTSTFQGDINFDVTPEGFSQVLCALFGPPTTTGTGPYTSVWSNTFTQTPVTLVQKVGNIIKCFPGARGNTFKLAIDATQDAPLGATVGFMALNEIIYVNDSDVGITGAGYDPNDPFGPVDPTLSINGVASAVAKTFDLNVNRNLGARQTLDGLRGATQHYSQVSDVSASATLFFNDDSQIKTFFGLASGQAAPYAASKTVLTQPVSITFVQGAFQLTISMTKAVFEKVGEPLQGQNEILQDVSISPLYDPATGTDLQITLINTQTNAVIVTAGTVIATVPSNSVTAYHNP